MSPVLSLSDVRIRYGPLAAVDGVSFDLAAGETMGLVGESGCGKSTLALAAMGAFSPGASLAGGRVAFKGRDLARLSPEELRRLRGGGMAMVHQDPAQALNPSLTVGEQLAETIVVHGQGGWAEGRRRAAERLADVRFTEVERALASYPHQLSGGQQQRVAIAMALMCDPELLILDEPTTGLDATIEAEVVELIAEVQRARGLALLYISHNLGLIGRVCERVAVMRAGRIVDEGPTARVFSGEGHPYVRELLSYVPDVNATTWRPSLPEAPSVIEAEGLTKVYGGARGLFDRIWPGRRREVVANDALDIDLPKGRVLGVVGESGSGKSTFARLLMGFETADAGRLWVNGADVSRIPVTRRSQAQRRAIQMVFQSTEDSLNPSYSIGRQIARALKLGGETDPAKRKARVRELLDMTRLPAGLSARRPDQLSGGQRQRAVIARAFAMGPDILVADEPVSALDPSVQAAVTELLQGLQRDRKVTLVVVSHDLGFVRRIADQVVVMQHGRIVEAGPTETVFAEPRHDYTRALLAAARANRPGAGEVA